MLKRAHLLRNTIEEWLTHTVVFKLVDITVSYHHDVISHVASVHVTHKMSIL
jgi:hypothetical protein